MKVYLKKLKNTKIYFFILKLIIIPLYTFFWSYILNFKNKLLNLFYKLFKNKTDYIDFEGNSKKIVFNNDLITKLAKEINDSLDQKFIDSKVEYIKSEKFKNKLSSDNEVHKLNPFVYNIFNDLNENLKVKIIEFATSDFMLKTANEYLGVFPILGRIYVNLNIPTGKEPRSSQLWHRDDFGYKNLDLFVAVNEINENNGPLITLKKKDPVHIFYRVKSEIKSGLKGERGKILDRDFDYLNSNKDESENIIKLKGNTGTALFIDSIRNYHKGGFCRMGNRITLRINYMTPDSSFPLENLDEERRQWKQLIKTKNFFSNYSMRNRNKIFKFFNVPKILFSFYHLLSIKR